MSGRSFDPPPGGPVAMSEADCLERLRHARAGYLATTARALPIIVPVALALADGELLVDPLFGHRSELAADAIVALAVGELSERGGQGEELWSVLAQGTLRAPGPMTAGLATPRDLSRYRAMEVEVITGWFRSLPGA